MKLDLLNRVLTAAALVSLAISRDALDAFEREATEAARPWQPPVKLPRRLR